MSLLKRAQHLNDAQFAELWTTGQPHPHLQTCAACRDAFVAFGAWASTLADDLRDEADLVFTPERLATQQAHIARRLEAMERPAKVIAFPVATPAVISGHSHVRRWVTAAAAAGLFFAGIGLGRFFEIDHTVGPRMAVVEEQRPVMQAHDALERGTPGIRAVSATYSDEEFLSTDTEAMGASIKELRALDDLTPHARDLVRK